MQNTKKKVNTGRRLIPKCLRIKDPHIGTEIQNNLELASYSIDTNNFQNKNKCMIKKDTGYVENCLCCFVVEGDFDMIRTCTLGSFNRDFN